MSAIGDKDQNIDGYAALLREIFYGSTLHRKGPDMCLVSRSRPYAVSDDGRDLILEMSGEGVYAHWFDWYRRVDGPALEPRPAHEVDHEGVRYRLVRALDPYLDRSDRVHWSDDVTKSQLEDRAFFDRVPKIKRPRKPRGPHFGTSPLTRTRS